MLESDHWSDNSSGLTSVNASYFFFPESELDCHPAVFWLGAAAMVLILSFFGFFRLPITSLLSFRHASFLGLMMTLCDMRPVASAPVQLFGETTCSPLMARSSASISA